LVFGLWSWVLGLGFSLRLCYFATLREPNSLRTNWHRVTRRVPAKSQRRKDAKTQRRRLDKRDSSPGTQNPKSEFPNPKFKMWCGLCSGNTSRKFFGRLNCWLCGDDRQKAVVFGWWLCLL